jgi:hypothetical protein
MGVEIEVIREASQELVVAFGRLLPQLSSSAKAKRLYERLGFPARESTVYRFAIEG